MTEATHSAATRNHAILLLGPTGSGKTPLGEIIERRGLWQRDCLHFDFGANLRRLVAANRPDAWVTQRDIAFLQEVLRTDALLEDKHFPLAQRILRSFMDRRGADANTWIVLNGLPRHVGQARALDALLAVRCVVCLECSEETVLRRLRTNAGGDRTGRIDDDPASVRRKLAIFRERTAPLLEYYGRASRVETIQVTATMTAEQMWERLQPG